MFPNSFSMTKTFKETKWINGHTTFIFAKKMRVAKLKNLPGFELDGTEIYDSDTAGADQKPITLSAALDRTSFFVSKNVEDVSQAKQYSISNESLDPRQAFAMFELKGQNYLEMVENPTIENRVATETVLQKFNRVKMEMGELVQYISGLQQVLYIFFQFPLQFLTLSLESQIKQYYRTKCYKR